MRDVYKKDAQGLGEAVDALRDVELRLGTAEDGVEDQMNLNSYYVIRLT
jgi:hypothetical protein